MSDSDSDSPSDRPNAVKPDGAGKQVRYILEHLRMVHPSSRTMKELSWWFVTMDKIGSGQDLKAALKTLKSRHLVRYNDPLGWQATS